MSPYRHSQTGYLIIAAAAVGFAVGLLAAGPSRLPSSWWIVFLIFAGVAAAFSRLTVEVAEGSLRVFFLPGWPRWRWPLHELASAQRVRNTWLMGWGIHWMPGLPGYWIINVSGYDAVEIALRNRRRYRIGTDDPEGLLAALRQAGVPVIQEG